MNIYLCQVPKRIRYTRSKHSKRFLIDPELAIFFVKERMEFFSISESNFKLHRIAHIHIRMYIYMYTYIHVYAYTCICIHMYIHICVYICIYVYKDMHLYAWVRHAYVCVRVCLYVCIVTQRLFLGFSPNTMKNCSAFTSSAYLSKYLSIYL